MQKSLSSEAVRRTGMGQEIAETCPRERHGLVLTGLYVVYIPGHSVQPLRFTDVQQRSGIMMSLRQLNGEGQT